MDVPGFREELLHLLSFEDRMSLSQTCVRLNHWVTRNVVVYRSATRGLYYAKYRPEPDRTFVYYEEYDPSYPAPVIFRWEGCAFDDSSDAFNDVVEAFTTMLRFSNSVRVIEISQAHGLCPEWVQVSRLKDFVNLRR